MNPSFIRFALISTVSFGLLFFFFKLRLHLPTIWAHLITINILGFLFYGYDKLAALRAWHRVPEAVLHILVALGATPAGILAQQLFWHKTTKRKFQIVFWLIALLQAITIYVVVYTDLLKMIF